MKSPLTYPPQGTTSHPPISPIHPSNSPYSPATPSPQEPTINPPSYPPTPTNKHTSCHCPIISVFPFNRSTQSVLMVFPTPPASGSGTEESDSRCRIRWYSIRE